MPELPEVERAAALIREVGAGKVIQRVETKEDGLVFSGTTHTDFAKEIAGRTLLDAKRYGKVFYLQLDGEGKHPVLHFGMTGMLQIKGQQATYYQSTPKSLEPEWPPRFMKFILHLKDLTTDTITELAFMDARRLGRVRLCASPLTESPISELGFDPILSMPAFPEFEAKVVKRSCPIKALLLDQSFSAGVGNWVADEILYNARIHPEQRCNTLSTEQLQAIHHQTKDVCEIAVSVNADSAKFPEHWLFKHRWGKGKKTKHDLLLPSGEPATIKWVTVGGRTSAYVVELQLRTRDADVPRDEEKGKPTNSKQTKRKRVLSRAGRSTRSKRADTVSVAVNEEGVVVEDKDEVGSELTSLSDLEIEAEVEETKEARSRVTRGAKQRKGVRSRWFPELAQSQQEATTTENAGVQEGTVDASVRKTRTRTRMKANAPSQSRKSSEDAERDMTLPDNSKASSSNTRRSQRSRTIVKF